jgi:hypothetical protein
MSGTRKIAAILVADIVRYSRLAGERGGRRGHQRAGIKHPSHRGIRDPRACPQQFADR